MVFDPNTELWSQYVERTGGNRPPEPSIEPDYGSDNSGGGGNSGCGCGCFVVLGLLMLPCIWGWAKQAIFGGPALVVAKHKPQPEVRFNRTELPPKAMDPPRENATAQTNKTSENAEELGPSIVAPRPAEGSLFSLPPAFTESPASAIAAEQAAKEVADQARTKAIEAAKWRTWVSAGGNFRCEAQFLFYANGEVTLQRRDGQRLTLTLEQLSAEDQDFITKRRWLEAARGL